MTQTTPAQNLTGERGTLLAQIVKQRYFLRGTARDLTDAQAGARPTVSELCIGGLIKHVTAVEQSWVDHITKGVTQKDFADITEADLLARKDEFRMLPGETLAAVLAAYAEVAVRTDEIIAHTDLDLMWPLPEAPWFQERAWSTRQVIIHLIAETAQHSGHADIIREAIDGAKSMG